MKQASTLVDKVIEERMVLISGVFFFLRIGIGGRVCMYVRCHWRR